MSIAERLASRFLLPNRIASRYFEDRYARLVAAMSAQEAKSVLGFPPGYNPTPEEINKAFKKKVIENHPDRGGSHEKMVEVNVAKDVLDGKANQRWQPDTSWKPGPYKRDPRPPRWQDDPETVYMKGQKFEAAWADSGIPAGVEWKFVSIPEWYWPSSSHPGHRVYVLYGQTDQKHIFAAFKERGEGNGVMKTELGDKTHIEEDWQSSMIDVSLSHNIAKIAPKYIKEVGTAWTDAKPKAPRKFVAWPGGKPTDEILKRIPRSGGAALKDILTGTGLLNDDDPSVVGRKSVVEVYTKYSKERYERAKKLKAEGKQKIVDAADQYDFFVRINGKDCKLEDDTITKMKRSFIPWVLKWEISEGAPKNLTRMRGRGMLTFDAAAAINELNNCLTSEPSWVHIALEKAAEEYQSESPKTAHWADVRTQTSLKQAAEALGVSMLELFNAIHEV